MGYLLADRDSIQILEIHTLKNEFDNRIILSDIEDKIQSGFHNFVFDLSKLNFMNSIGINFLILALRKSKQSGGKLALANIPSHVGKLLNITRLESIFTIKPTVNEAINFLQNE